MKERTVTATRLKAQLLALLDDVANGDVLVVTKRGKPVARVVPPDPAPSLRGSVTYLVDDEALISPIPARWHAERG
jgi:prevent-host-death family protein